MTEKLINKSQYQLEMKIDSQKKGKIKKVQNEKESEIKDTLRRAREVIEDDISKLYPIQSGEISLFKDKKKFGFIRPDDLWRQPIFMKDPERIFKLWEKVNYIEINHEALVTSKGIIRSISNHNGEHDVDSFFVIVTSDDNDKDVELYMKPTFPHNKVEWHANVVDKSKPEYPIDISSFNRWDEVEFVANKKWTIVAFQKK